MVFEGREGIRQKNSLVVYKFNELVLVENQSPFNFDKKMLP